MNAVVFTLHLWLFKHVGPKSFLPNLDKSTICIFLSLSIGIKWGTKADLTKLSVFKALLLAKIQKPIKLELNLAHYL